MDEEVNDRVLCPGARVALVDDGGLFGLDVEAFDDVDRALIDLGIGDVALVSAPPVTGIAAHLFLRDELGHTIGDGIVRLGIGGDLRFLAAGKLDDEDGAVPHEADELSGWGNAGVVLKGLGLGELARFGARFRQRDKMKVAAKRYQDRVCRAPVIADNALAPSDTLALTQRFFFFRQFNVFRLQQGRVDQHALRPGLHIELPEIIAAGVCFARLQKGHTLAIGRIFHPRRRRPA